MPLTVTYYNEHLPHKCVSNPDYESTIPPKEDKVLINATFQIQIFCSFLKELCFSRFSTFNYYV